MKLEQTFATQLTDRKFKQAVRWLKRWREEGHEAGALDPQIVAWCIGVALMLRIMAGEDDEAKPR